MGESSLKMGTDILYYIQYGYEHHLVGHSRGLLKAKADKWHMVTKIWEGKGIILFYKNSI